jgi:hypothetical protein
LRRTNALAQSHRGTGHPAIHGLPGNSNNHQGHQGKAKRENTGSLAGAIYEFLVILVSLVVEISGWDVEISVILVVGISGSPAIRDARSGVLAVR